VRSRRAGDESVRRVNRHPFLSEARLVAAGPGCGLARGFEETKPREQRTGRRTFFLSDAALDFGNRHTTRAQGVVVCQEIEQQGSHRLVAPQMTDKHRRVEEIETQAFGSVRRTSLTQDAATLWSRHCV